MGIRSVANNIANEIYSKYVIREESEGKPCCNNLVSIVSAGDFIKYGVKPQPGAVLNRVYGALSEDSSVFVAGDSAADLILTQNIKKELKNSDFYRKVRVNSVMVNRYGNANKLADYNVGSLNVLGKLVTSEGCDFLVCDWDNTLVQCFLKKSVSHKEVTKSNMNRFGMGLPVRLGFGLFILYDTVLSAVRVNKRKFYRGSEDDLNNFFDIMKDGNVRVVLNSLCPGPVIKGMLNKKGIKYSKNGF